MSDEITTLSSAVTLARESLNEQSTSAGETSTSDGRQSLPEQGNSVTREGSPQPQGDTNEPSSTPKGEDTLVGMTPTQDGTIPAGDTSSKAPEGPSISDLAKQIVDTHKGTIPEIEEIVNTLYRTQQGHYDRLKRELEEQVNAYRGINPNDVQMLQYLNTVQAQYGQQAARAEAARLLGIELPTTLPPAHSPSEDQGYEWASEGEERLAKENAELKARLEAIEQRTSSSDKAAQSARDLKEYQEFTTEFGRQLSRDELLRLDDYMSRTNAVSLKDAAYTVFRDEVIRNGIEQGVKAHLAVAQQKRQQPPAPNGIAPTMTAPALPAPGSSLSDIVKHARENLLSH